MKNKLLLVATSITFLLSAQPVMSADSDIFSTIEGTWAWKDRENCGEKWHRIEFRDNNTTAYFWMPEGKTSKRTGKNYYTYEVRGHDRKSIRMFLNGEDRKDKEGNLVVWDLVLVDNDRYCWHRTDWKPGGCTKKILRCN